MRKPINIHALYIFNFISIFILSAQPFPPPGSPLANGEHPRLVFTDATLQSVIEPYISTYESSNFQNWINTLDAAYNESPGGKNRNLLLADCMNYAFLSYAVESGYFSGFSFGHTASEYANEAYDQAAQAFTIDEFGGGLDEDAILLPNEGWNVSLGLACVYDWCFDYLTTNEKQNIADEMWDYYNAWSNRDGWGEAAGRRYCNVLLPGFTWYQDNLGSSYDANAQTSLDKIESDFRDRSLRFVNQIYEGKFGWTGGITYTTNLTAHIPWFFACYQSATGNNIYSEFPLLTDIPAYYRYKIDPLFAYEPGRANEEGYWFEKSEAGTFWDFGFYKFWTAVKGHAALMHDAFPDIAGFAIWFLNSDPRYGGITDTLNNTRISELWYHFLLGTKDITEKSASQINLPNSIRLGQGRTWMYSELNSDNATKIYFECPTFTYTSHSNSNNAAINIYKKGALLVETGHNKSGGLPRLNSGDQEPIFQNVIVFYDGSDPLYDFNPSANNGESYYLHPSNQIGGSNHIGTVNAIDLEGINYDFVDYDYTRTYQDETYLDIAVRKILYIRDPNVPNYTNDEWFVVYDSVEVNDSNYYRRFLFHTAQLPEITDGSLGNVGGKKYTGSGTIWKITNNFSDVGGGSSTPNNMNGRMFMKTLIQPDTIIGYGGGSGNWHTDATGNALAFDSGIWDGWDAAWDGKYRWELQDNTGTTSEFLTIFQICDDTTYNSMSPVTKIDAGNFVGALMNEERITFFNKTVNPKPGIAYSFTSPKTVKHFITGLEQGTYFVNVDGSSTGISKFISEGEVLYFEYSGGGSFAINKSNDPIPPQVPQGLRITR